PPARSAIEGDVLVGSDAGLLPVGGDLRVGAHRVVEVAVVLHVVGVGAAVAPHVAGDASCRADVVVTAVLTDVLVPGADADEGGAFGVGEDLLGLVDVDDGFGPLGDPNAERGDRLGLAADRFERVTGLNPGVVAAVEQADVVDAAVVQDQRGASGGNLAGATARPFLIGVAFGVAAVQAHGRIVRDAERAHGLLEHLRWTAIPVQRILELVGVEIERTRKVVLLVLLRNPEVDVEE